MPGSPAAKTRIVPGDILRKINGNTICDVLDYDYHSYDSELLLDLLSPDGKIKLIEVRKPESTDLGLEFDSYLMDKERHCANKCIFCFIDQLPGGMRETLYYKDDDVRLSFLQGNYITLTNLSRRDIERIIKLRISPINVSVHTLDPDLRSLMLGTTRGGRGIKVLRALARAGITLNCQIVCCPGINDGRELSKTIEEFIKLGPAIKSVSIVPVGLTKHRKGLMELCAFDKDLAMQTVIQVDHYGTVCQERHAQKRGSRVFFCADELYMMAGLMIPPDEFYEDYPQLENGVGMMRLFITEFENALRLRTKDVIKGVKKDELSRSKYTIITGVLAYPYIKKLFNTIIKKYDTISGEVYAVRNVFFGESVTVSGLITGRDIVAQLKGKDLGDNLLIPQNMLRHGEEVFLDDLTVTDVSRELGVPVRIVKPDGADLLNAILEQ